MVKKSTTRFSLRPNTHIFFLHSNMNDLFRVKLDTSLLKGIDNDMDFCFKVVKKVSVIVLPGMCVLLRNWLGITFAIEPESLEDGFRRFKSFYERHSKK
ncbi:hypothetical protein RJ641_017534, partial [Dillenia turbinata]